MVPNDLVLQLLKKRISDLGLTYKEAAEQCGVSCTGRIAGWLNGDTHLPAVQLDRMLHGLGIVRNSALACRIVLAFMVYELPPATGESLLTQAGLLHHLQE